MDLPELRDKVTHDLAKKIVTTRILCNKCRLLDEASRRSSAYTDDTYIPFYYHLGKYLQPKSVFRFGFDLGLMVSSFLQNCGTVERLLVFQPMTEAEGYTAWKLGAKNIRDVYDGYFEVYAGKFSDPQFQERLLPGWDLVMVNTETDYDDFRYVLDVLWERVQPQGWMVVDRVAEGAAGNHPFHDFCKVRRLEPVIIETRHGVGIVTKE